MSQIEILLAVRNGEKYIEQQLQSLLDQDLQDFTISIRDNASTDTTPAILKKWSEQYPDQIQVTYGDENLGIIGNFATLLDHSTAPYVMFCDSDDVWLPSKVRQTFELMKKEDQNKPLLVHTDLHVVDQHLSSIHPSYWAYTNRGGATSIPFHRALVENQVTGCTMMLNRPLIDLVKPIPQNVSMHDAWISLVAAAFGQVIALNQSTLLYRQHSNNDSGAKQYGLISLLKKIIDPKQRQNILHTREKRKEQTKEFQNRFEHRLTDNQKALLTTYATIENQSFLTRLYRLKKNDLFESGLLRKVYQVFF